MRAAILMPSRVLSADKRAETSVIGAMLEEALASSTANRRLVPIGAGHVTAALARALDLDVNDHPAAVLMIVAESHRLLEADAAETAELERATREATEEADREVEGWMAKAYEAVKSGDPRRA